MDFQADGQTEIIVEATIIRAPGSKYLKPGDPLVQPQGVIAHYKYKPSLLRRARKWLQRLV